MRSIYFMMAFMALPVAAANSAEIDTLLKAATEGQGQSSYTAIDRLGALHQNAAQAVPQLQKLLGSADAKVRWHSARALGDYGDLAVSSAADLRKLLADDDPIVRYHAAGALGKIGDRSEETVSALVTAATNPDGRVARAAIAALRTLKPGPERVMAALRAALKSNDQAVTLYALEAIVSRRGEAAPLLIEALKQPETAYLACAAIEQIGPDAAATVPALTEILGKTKHSRLLIQSLLALASIGPGAQSAAPQIVELLDSSTDATVPVAAAYALGSMGAKNADAQLRGAMAKNNPFLQMIAAWALAKIHADDQAAVKLAVDKLAQGLQSEDPMIRNAAAKSLQSLQAPPDLVAPALVMLINDADLDVQNNVIDAIASLGESAVPRVCRALQNPDLRKPAAKVLAKIGPKAAAAVQPLMDVAPQADPEFRTEIQLALAAIGPAAAPATDLLVQSVGSNNDGIRESALYALRQIGPGAAAAVQPLIQRANADDSFAAFASAWAVAAIAPDNPPVAAAIVPKLTKALTNADEQIRLESATILGTLGALAKPAGAALQSVAKEDASAEVRAAATAALQRIGS